MPAEPAAGDGLAELQAARLSRQHRRPPAPKRARTTDPAPPVVREKTASGGEKSAARTPTTDTPGPPVAPPAVTDASSGVPDDGPLTLVQVQVTEAQLDYLDEIEAVATTRRLDVTDAAVIRLVLGQLMAAHTPDKIVERLGRPKVRGCRGRPRYY